MEANLDRLYQRKLARNCAKEKLSSDVSKLDVNIQISSDHDQLQEEYNKAVRESLDLLRKKKLLKNDSSDKKNELQKKIIDTQERILRAKKSIRSSKFSMMDPIPDYNPDFIYGIPTLEQKILKMKATIENLRAKRPEWQATQELLNRLEKSPTIAKIPDRRPTSIFKTSLKEIEAISDDEDSN